MAEISIPEEEFGEPMLNYWKPVPKPPPVAVSPVVSPFTPSCTGNGYDNFGWSHQVPTFNHPALPPQYVYHQTSYPLNNVINSYIRNQQIGLPPDCMAFEAERRKPSQYSLIGADHVLYTLSTNPDFEQESQTMTDNMIQDEVTRAAKTLFSKRNRTLLHWLNPDVNKNQIKTDVNAAWDSLPAAEKVFYISQVLGKFSPHVTSLMVNPQLEPSNMESSSVKGSCNDKNCDRTYVDESISLSSNKIRRKSKKTQVKNKLDIDVRTIKSEIKIKEENCDSGCAVNVDKEEKPKKVGPVGEKQRVKRKYTKRKHKEAILEQNVSNNSNSCSLPVDVKDIKVEPGTEFPIDVKDIKVEPGIEFPVDIKDIKTEPGTVPVYVKNIKVKSNTNMDKNLSNVLPRPKRKYVKRKLVRKKYKRREPKQKPPILQSSQDYSEKIKSEENLPEAVQNAGEEMEMDLWIHLGNDSILTNDEVDRFFDSIEDPDSLFRELGIIEN